MADADPRLEIARRLVGSPRDAPPTPALILDLALVEKNIAEMKRRMDPLPASLRPHAKIHKSPMLGRMQLDAGAIGLTTATVWEASAMIDAGLSPLLTAFAKLMPDQTLHSADQYWLANTRDIHHYIDGAHDPVFAEVLGDGQVGEDLVALRHQHDATLATRNNRRQRLQIDFRLSGAGDPEKGLEPIPAPEARRKLGDRLGLIAGRLKRRLEVEDRAVHT